jgi:hypothetical protein
LYVAKLTHALVKVFPFQLSSFTVVVEVSGRYATVSAHGCHHGLGGLGWSANIRYAVLLSSTRSLKSDFVHPHIFIHGVNMLLAWVDTPTSPLGIRYSSPLWIILFSVLVIAV